MKNNQGVTMMQIVITIIVMIILLSIAIFYGQGTTREATIAAFYNEIREVTSAIQEADALNQIKTSGDSIVFYGETSAPKVEKTAYADQLANAGEGDFYYLDFTSNKSLKNTLELENVKSDYILHYNTLKVYLKDGVTLIDETGKEVIRYSADEVVSYYNNVLNSSKNENNTYTIKYDANGGSNAPSNQFANAGASINITTSEPTRSGYKFIGWSISKNACTATYQPGALYNPTANVTLYAVWESTSNSLTIEMSDYQYGGTKSEPNLAGGSSESATYYYNTIDSNAGGYAWVSVKDSTTLSVGTYYMYAIVANQATPTVQFKVNQAEGSITYNKSSIDKALGDDSFTNTLTKIGDGTVLYSSSNLNVATVDLKGVVKIVGVGETTITAIVEDGKNYTYPTKTASYTLVVNRGELVATVKMSGYTYEGTVSIPSVAGNVESGDVTYYYSTVNTNSGGFEWKDITPTSLNAGTYYMYAVIAETANHKEFTTQPVEFTIEKADAKLSLASREINKQTSDDPFTNELTDTGNGSIRYSSSNTKVAIVKDNGQVIIQGAGEAIIIATVTPTQNYKYEYITITYTIKVTKATPYLMSRALDDFSLRYLLGYERTGCGTTYTASSIKTVTFQNTKTAPANYVATWNVSADGKNAVKAWLVPTSENSALYDMYIGADLAEGEKIIAPSDCTALFMYHTSLTTINGLELLDMSKVTSTRGMFWECVLQKLDLSSWNTTSLTNIQDMFAYNRALTELNMNIDVSKVTNAHGVFFECSSLTKLTLGDFNLANAGTMEYLFYNCNKLKSIDGKLTTEKATIMTQMFYQCKSLESIDLSAVKTSQATTMSSMFAECTSLKNLDLSGFDTSKVENMARMFYRCENLTNLDLSNFDTRKVTDMHEMFYDSDNLAIIKLGKNFDKINGASMFSYCSNLKAIITLRNEPMTLVTTVYLNSNCVLYTMDAKAEQIFESGENYASVFGNSVKDTTRDDSSTDICRICTILELAGDATTYVEIGNEYTEQGVKVAGMTANDDGTYTPYGYTVSSSIKNRSGNAVNEIDTSKAGTYTITYKLSDANGEVAEATRTVKVTMIHSVANGPILNTSEMKAVYWNESGDEFETTSFELAQTEEGTIYNTTLYNYNYSFDDDIYELGTDTYDVKWALKPRWANAKTTDDGSYWVWIPRYAYKITYYTGSDKKTVSETKTQYGSIDVIFLKDKSNNEYIDKNGDTQTLPKGYTVHPAFQKMSQEEATEGNRLGKWSEELTGIWVAKYEASQEVSENGTEWTTRNIESETEGNILTTNAGNTENVRVVSKPSVNSWRYSYISKMYVNSLYMNATLNTHQMKNSEWGAVAYLTYSVYGRNGNELAVNQCENYYTGAGLGSGTSTVYNSTYSYSEDTFASAYAWNTDLGKLTSTTGNIYGIYDMSGGAWEYVASYVNNGHDNLMIYGNDSENGGDNLVNDSVVTKTIENMKTKQIYLSTTSSGDDTQSADYALCKDTDGTLHVYGDAVFETSTGSKGDGWCGDYLAFPTSLMPFFRRGNNYGNATAIGIFYLLGGDGYGEGSGFRPVICITSSK